VTLMRRFATGTLVALSRIFYIEAGNSLSAIRVCTECDSVPRSLGTLWRVGCAAISTTLCLLPLR